MGLLEQLQHIETQVNQLKEANEKLRKENAELQLSTAKLSEELKRSKQQLLIVEETNKISKLAQGVIPEENKEAVKNLLNELINEVEDCLKLVKDYKIDNHGL